MNEPPQIGDLVRVGNGDVAWTVIGVSEFTGIVMLSSSDSGLHRSEMPSNLERF